MKKPHPFNHALSLISPCFTSTIHSCSLHVSAHSFPWCNPSNSLPHRHYNLDPSATPLTLQSANIPVRSGFGDCHQDGLAPDRLLCSCSSIAMICLVGNSNSLQGWPSHPKRQCDMFLHDRPMTWPWCDLPIRFIFSSEKRKLQATLTFLHFGSCLLPTCPLLMFNPTNSLNGVFRSSCFTPWCQPEGALVTEAVFDPCGLNLEVSKHSNGVAYLLHGAISSVVSCSLSINSVPGQEKLLWIWKTRVLAPNCCVSDKGRIPKDLFDVWDTTWHLSSSPQCLFKYDAVPILFHGLRQFGWILLFHIPVTSHLVILSSHLLSFPIWMDREGCWGKMRKMYKSARCCKGCQLHMFHLCSPGAINRCHCANDGTG